MHLTPYVSPLCQITQTHGVRAGSPASLCSCIHHQVDLQLTHGAYVPARAQRACTEAIASALCATHGSVAVHVGRQNAVDVMQADMVRARPAVTVVEHETFHHNVPMFLEREGALVPLLKRELLELLRPKL